MLRCGLQLGKPISNSFVSEAC
uniref:Uncharacterized protein n=1 Tax=Arundo donax TaxID=35708 RepID=A0A0A9FMK0_ARUDO